jgi:hypothetical protein
MGDKVFENIIKSYLDKATFADALRNLSEDFNGELQTSVEQMLDDASFASEFDFNGYDNEEQKGKVMKKLLAVRGLVFEKCGVDLDSPDLQYVLKCIKYVQDGYALTPKTVDNLNQIYKRYA